MATVSSRAGGGDRRAGIDAAGARRVSRRSWAGAGLGGLLQPPSRLCADREARERHSRGPVPRIADVNIAHDAKSRALQGDHYRRRSRATRSTRRWRRRTLPRTAITHLSDLGGAAAGLRAGRGPLRRMHLASPKDGSTYAPCETGVSTSPARSRKRWLDARKSSARTASRKRRRPASRPPRTRYGSGDA